MRLKLLIVAAGFVFSAATAALAQVPINPVGPVTPRPSREIESLEKALQGLIKTDAPVKVWRAADAAKLDLFMEQINGTIDGIRIGPVTPRPKPKPLGTTPPKPPGPKPSQQAFQESLTELVGALQSARTKDPGTTLPAADARDLQGIIDTLSKGRLP